MGDLSDEEQSWIARSRSGDQEACAALVQRYQKMIFALAFRMTGSQTDAEDLTQESFVAAFDQLHSFRGDSKFSSWLYRIATNRCLNWRQRHNRRERAYQHWNTERERSATGSDDESALGAEVHQALLKLDEKQRAAIVLTTYEGLNHAEAAQVLGCSETTVSWRIFAARRKLKKWLSPLARGSRV